MLHGSIFTLKNPITVSATSVFASSTSLFIIAWNAMVSDFTLNLRLYRAPQLIVCADLDFDLCHECYDKDPTEHTMDGHYFGHAMALVAAYLQENRVMWILHQNKREVERCNAIIQEKQRDELSDDLSYDGTGQSGNFLDHSDDTKPHEGFGDYNVATAKNSCQLSASLMKENLYTCCVCGAGVTLESRFFICGEYSCSGGFHLIMRPNSDH